MYFGKKKEEKKSKVFQNQYVIAQDLKIPCRYTAQSDVRSIQKCIWFTAGEVEGGSILSKFPEIARGIDYLISNFSLKVYQRVMIKEMLMILRKLQFFKEKRENSMHASIHIYHLKQSKRLFRIEVSFLLQLMGNNRQNKTFSFSLKYYHLVVSRNIVFKCWYISCCSSWCQQQKVLYFKTLTSNKFQRVPVCICI